MSMTDEVGGVVYLIQVYLIDSVPDRDATPILLRLGVLLYYCCISLGE